MVSSVQIEQAIHRVSDQESFIHELLRNALGWQIPDDVEQVEDIAFKWKAKELRADGLDRKIVDGHVWQIQPLDSRIARPWGVFILDFKYEDAFVSDRGLTGPLRKVLRGLVPRRRMQGANLKTWKREDLLFMCTHKYHHFRFAHFKAPPTKEKTAPLAQFGWNWRDSEMRTLCEHNLPHLNWDLDDPQMDHWREAFSIEKVTKEFYRQYEKAFDTMKKIIEDHNLIADEDLRLFTQTLFNRLMFLRFIEKKGWLNFNGRTDYLRALYAGGGIKRQSFYRSRLRPLFFEALAVQGKQKSQAVGEVVFLNGGLFAETDLDKKINDIPNDAFKDLLDPSGLLYKFNFTVQESTPFDIEVAVDPEMLGKVFEELVTGRHEKGSYYTPRPVVAFMCREAIKGFLSAKTSASKKAISKLVDDHEIAKDLTERHAQEILFYLETIKAVDPACGSGAYLLGLLQQLIAVRRTLQNPELESDPGFLFTLKLRLIRQCLYGVDIDPFATSIAKLRLWLSLAVEAEAAQPLPNLDFKIETGDSVLGLCSAFAQTEDALVVSALRDRVLKLVSQKDRYMLAHDAEKEKLYEQIKTEEEAIAGDTSTDLGERIIAWHVHFAEVFATSRRQRSLETGAFNSDTFKMTICEPAGFDIVLANPPYVRQELIKDIKPRLKEVFPQTYMGTADLYTYFYARAIEMLGPDGMLVFISSNKWFRANYGKKLRAHVAKNSNVQSITDFKDSPIFEAATAYPMIFVAQKTKKRTKAVYTEAYVPSGEGLDVAGVINSKGRTLPDTAINGQEWSFADQAALQLISTMRQTSSPLHKYIDGKLFYGIKTGLNKAFVIDSETRKRLIQEDASSKELIRPLLMGKDIKRWSISNGRRWMIVTPIGVDIKKHPAVFDHLRQWQRRLKARQDQGNHWWELRTCAYYSEFEKPKIVFPDIAPRARFALDLDGHYLGNTGYIIPLTDLYLLGVLNSQAVNEFYINLSSQVRGGYLRFIHQYVAQIPIPRASKTEKKTIENLVQRCLDAEGQNCEHWEREIDDRVARLYGIKPNQSIPTAPVRQVSSYAERIERPRSEERAFYHSTSPVKPVAEAT